MVIQFLTSLETENFTFRQVPEIDRCHACRNKISCFVYPEVTWSPEFGPSIWGVWSKNNRITLCGVIQKQQNHIWGVWSKNNRITLFGMIQKQQNHIEECDPKKQNHIEGCDPKTTESHWLVWSKNNRITLCSVIKNNRVTFDSESPGDIKMKFRGIWIAGPPCIFFFGKTKN